MVPSQAIIRTDLMAPFTEFDLAFNRSKFIGPKVFVPFATRLQSADVGKLRIEDLLQNRDTSAAPGAGTKRGKGDFDKYNYATSPYRWEEAVDDWQSKVYRDLIDAEETASMRVMDALAGHFERDVAAATFDTATWTGAALTTGVTIPWSTHASAIPIDDVFAAREKVFAGTGLDSNALILNFYAYWHLCQCAQILERVKYTKEATQDQIMRDIAAVLGVDQILVAGGAQNSANPEQAASISRIWSNTMAMVARVTTRPNDPKDPCIGRTFMWTEDGPGALATDEEIAVLMDEYREESILGSVIRGRNNRHVCLMYKEAGHLLTNVAA